MPAENYRHAVIGMMMAGLEIPAEGDLSEMNPEVIAMLGKAFEYDYSGNLTLPMDPVPAAEVGRLIQDSLESFRDGLVDRCQRQSACAGPVR